MILKLIIHSEKRFCKIHFNQHKGNNSMCDKIVQSLVYVWLNFMKTSSHSKAPLLQCTHVSILLQQSWRGFNNMHVYLSDRKMGKNYLIIFCIIFFKKWHVWIRFELRWEVFWQEGGWFVYYEFSVGSQGPFSPASHQRMSSRPGDYIPNDNMPGTALLSDWIPYFFFFKHFGFLSVPFSIAL